MLVQRCSTLKIPVLTYTTLFNVDLTFPDLAGSYQSNTNIETTLKCLLDHYQENTKQLKNEMKQKERCKTCKICHINAWNTAYFRLYLVFKHSRTLKLTYI